MFQYEKAKKLSDLALKQGKKAVVHLALDTGMSRIGMKADREHAKEAAAIAALEGIEVEGLFTHFARADEIRNMLSDKGIILEDTREGVRWKRA